MAFHLRPLAEEDISECVSIYFAAFQNAHSLACWPRTDSVRRWWANMISDELHETGSYWLKTIIPGTEEIVGFAKWQEPKPGSTPDTSLPEWPKDADQKLCDETFGAWAKAHAELMGNKGHWYLEMVATCPAHQGKGAGSQMMRWGLQKADADGVEAYLEASPDAVPLYERFGFKEAGRTKTWIENDRVNGESYTNLYMIRPAAVSNAKA